MRCGVRSSAVAAVRRWAKQHTRPVVDGTRLQPGQLANPQYYWETQYVAGSAADEWFMGAEEAAESTVDALGECLRGAACRARPLQVLNLGCGTSRMGHALADALATRHGLEARVMNVDYSPAAIRVASAASAHDHRQHYRVWDASAGTPPPALPAQPQPARYHLVVDKGTMDALLFAGEDRLVSYCATLHDCLLPWGDATSCDAGAPLFVHFSDDEARGELLEAAFPGARSWRVECSELELESATGWSTFRYVVSHRAGELVSE